MKPRSEIISFWSSENGREVWRANFYSNKGQSSRTFYSLAEAHDCIAVWKARAS